MTLKSEVDQLFFAAVESGNIRYQAWPAGNVAVAVAADVELFAAAGAPAVPYWFCGFQYSVATGLVVAEHVMLATLGYGGVDGANPPAVVLLTDWPLVFTAVAAALGPVNIQPVLLPYPVLVPAGSRMAINVAASIGAGVALSSCKALVAIAVGA